MNNRTVKHDPRAGSPCHAHPGEAPPQPRGFGEPDRCPRCESIFAPSDVIRRISHRTGVATTSAHCTHCDVVLQVRQVLRGGGWVDESPAAVIESVKGRAAVKRALESIRGQIRLAALSA